MAYRHYNCNFCTHKDVEITEEPCVSCVEEQNGIGSNLELTREGTIKISHEVDAMPDWEAEFKKAELEKRDLQIKLDCAEKDVEWFRNQLIHYRAIAETVEVIFGRKFVK